MALGANPTGVNSFTGTSDETKTAEVAQGLWDRLLAAESEKTTPQSVPPPAAPAAEVPAAASEPEKAEAFSSDDEVEYSDLDDYLTKANLERDSFLSLPVPLKVDGKDERATLKELIEAGQLRRHAQLETQKVSERQKAWETERAQAQQAIQQQWQQAQALATFARQQLFAEYQGLEKLRAENPTEWVVKLQELQLKDNALQGQLAQFHQAQQQQLTKQIETERTRMFEANPEWRDQAKFQAAQQQISSYAQARGFTQAELSGVVDHRYLMVLADASRAKDLQAQVDTLKAQLEGKTAAAVKKVRAAPQIASPGARVVRDPKVVALSGSKDAFLRNSRNPDAQAAYAEALLAAGA